MTEMFQRIFDRLNNKKHKDLHHNKNKRTDNFLRIVKVQICSSVFIEINQLKILTNWL